MALTLLGGRRRMMSIAGDIGVTAVMAELVTNRSVFHSEADFQHAFARTLHHMRPAIEVRLEARQAGGEHLDLLCFGPHGRTAVEFKYFTARWDGIDPATGEPYQLREHGADDVARRNFIFDVARLERLFTADATLTNGLAIMLTNHQRLWTTSNRSTPTRDQQFRIHEGRTLTGTLRWGTQGSFHSDNERYLNGTYPLSWNDYANLKGRNGQLRWLGIDIRAAG
ncbi:hypothetical protein ACIBPB_25985 [Micromonospora sp. NPDC049836]|uniref:hypothetical protein n=1 Tax=Micromonospora sp. NPDC049836 TaxID=3364274 RepID=UPI00379409E6